MKRREAVHIRCRVLWLFLLTGETGGMGCQWIRAGIFETQALLFSHQQMLHSESGAVMGQGGFASVMNSPWLHKHSGGELISPLMFQESLRWQLCVWSIGMNVPSSPKPIRSAVITQGWILRQPSYCSQGLRWDFRICPQIVSHPCRIFHHLISQHSNPHKSPVKEGSSNILVLQLEKLRHT